MRTRRLRPLNPFGPIDATHPKTEEAHSTNPQRCSSPPSDRVRPIHSCRQKCLGRRDSLSPSDCTAPTTRYRPQDACRRALWRERATARGDRQTKTVASGAGRTGRQKGRRRLRRGSFQTRAPGSGYAALEQWRGIRHARHRRPFLPFRREVRWRFPAATKIGQGACRCNDRERRLSQCSGLLSGQCIRSSGRGVLNPRAPSAPATADVPLRCIPTTKSHEPADRSEVVPARFGLLMGEGSSGRHRVIPGPLAPAPTVNNGAMAGALLMRRTALYKRCHTNNPNDVGSWPRFRPPPVGHGSWRCVGVARSPGSSSAMEDFRQKTPAPSMSTISSLMPWTRR